MPFVLGHSRSIAAIYSPCHPRRRHAIALLERSPKLLSFIVGVIKYRPLAEHDTTRARTGAD